MKSLRRPSDALIRAFLDSQAKFDFTYPAVGATATTPPAGYFVDHTRIKLGDGEAVFRAGKEALAAWDQLKLGWVEAWPPTPPLQAGELVAIVARRLGVWWLNACRIVYVVDENGPITRTGFANGTLPDHAGTGEERFLIEWDNATGAVHYDILAFSRPHRCLSRVGYRYMRRVQKRFGLESSAAMVRSVETRLR